MAARKVSIYGLAHPMAGRAVEKPFLLLEHVFRYKRYVNLNLRKGDLYVINIRLQDSVFCSELVRYLQLHEITSLVFERLVTMDELTKFLGHFVRRLNPGRPGNHLSDFLERKSLHHITVNTEMGVNLFENHGQYRGDVGGVLSIKQLVLNQLGDNPAFLGWVEQVGDEALMTRAIDWDLDIVQYLIPEKVANIATDDFVAYVSDMVSRIASEEDESLRYKMVERCRSVCGLLKYHARRDTIVEQLNQVFTAETLPPEVAPELSNPAQTVKEEACRNMERLLGKSLTPRATGEPESGLRDAFLRLLRTGQSDRAIMYLTRLLDYLEVNQTSQRQRALELLDSILNSLKPATDETVLVNFVDVVCQRVAQHRETFEYSGVIWCLADQCMSHRRFDIMDRLVSGIATRRRIDDNGVVAYDSVAVKHALGAIERAERIDDLVNEFVRADHDNQAHLRNILIALGTEEVAVSLSDIITYPSRQVRQGALRVLSELGKASLKIFSQIMVDDDLFRREPGRRELPDEQWYVVRNSVFVLGSIQDREGVVALRLRISDSDVRVRREIVSALEKIGGEEACDLLILMAEDCDVEIAEAAIIAAGLVGGPDMAPLVADVAERCPHLATRVMSALGHLGGDEARDHLVTLLTNDTRLSRLARGAVSSDDLRLAIVKALGLIGDTEALNQIRRFGESRTRKRPLLKRPTALDQVLSEILGSL